MNTDSDDAKRKREELDEMVVKTLREYVKTFGPDPVSQMTGAIGVLMQANGQDIDSIVKGVGKFESLRTDKACCCYLQRYEPDEFVEAIARDAKTATRH